MAAMLSLVGILAAGGIHIGWVAVPPIERVSVVADLRVGEMVHVKDVQGRSVDGAIVDATSATLTILDEGRLVVMEAEDVRAVLRQDSVVNGVLLGVASGLLGWFVGVDKVCREAECGLARAFPVSLGVGAAIGAGVDAVMHARLYSQQDHVEIRVVPAVFDSGVEARLSVTW